MQEIKACLWKMQDVKYKEFQSKLMPTVDPDSIIGVENSRTSSLGKNVDRYVRGRRILARTST